MIKMDSRVFDTERYHKRNMFMSKDFITQNDRPQTMVIDAERKEQNQGITEE